MSLADWDDYQKQVANILMAQQGYEKWQAFETAAGFYEYYMDAYDPEDAVNKYMNRIYG